MKSLIATIDAALIGVLGWIFLDISNLFGRIVLSLTLLLLLINWLAHLGMEIEVHRRDGGPP